MNPCCNICTPVLYNPVRAGGAGLQATFLYADLRQSTYLSTNYQNRTAAKVIKSFIYSVCRLIKANKGTITSFDGDRVMGVFVGKDKNSRAVQTGLQINWVVTNVVNPKATSHFSSIGASGFDIAHGVGIDTGEVLTVRAGQRGANDLVWVGRAPNVAAKLSDIADSNYPTYIHNDVYVDLSTQAKLSQGKNMWHQASTTVGGTSIVVYKSSYLWTP